MALNFSDKILIVNPTAFYLGRGAVVLALIAVAFGAASYFVGDIVMPARIWFAVAVPTIAIGGILIATSLRKG